jgi:type III secretion system FlhB-like substrate exporter
MSYPSDPTDKHRQVIEKVLDDKDRKLLKHLTNHDIFDNLTHLIYVKVANCCSFILLIVANILL